MLRNYWLTAFRHLRKDKTHSFINIAGLSIGMAVALLIGLWIHDELSFNTGFANYNRIAQAYTNLTISGQRVTGNSMPVPMAGVLRSDYGSNFQYVVTSTWNYGHLLSVGDKVLNEDGSFMEDDAPGLLSLKMLEGSGAGLRQGPSLLLSHSLAIALFGDAPAMGKTIRVDNQNNMTVRGVYADLPANSSFADVHFIGSWQGYLAANPWIGQMEDQWGNNSWLVYVAIAPNTTMTGVSARIRDAKQKNVSNMEKRNRYEVFLHPMSRWNLYSRYENGVNTGGRIEYLWMFGTIGIFVLLLACINFMNLSTARSERRAQEVGIRKAIGGLRRQLIAQFFAESLLLTLVAYGIALVLVDLSLQPFNELAGKHVTMPWNSTGFWLGGLVFCLLTGLVSGSYPALYLSSFRPVKVLKGIYKAGRLAALPRQVLVVLQFTVCVSLIIATIVVFRQIQYAKDRPTGFDRDRLVMVQRITKDIHQHFAAVKAELKNAGVISEMAEAGGPPTSVWSTNGGFDWAGKDPNVGLDIPNTGVSADFGKTVGWQIVAGRDFSDAYATDSVAFVLNETAVKFMGLKHPVGTVIKWDGEPFHVIGVIKDIVMESPYFPVRASFFCMAKGHDELMLMRVPASVDMSAALDKIKRVFAKYDPSEPFGYQFADKEYEKKFGEEQRVGRLAGVFALLAILISCLGVFGMASYMAERRTREIGIRKVLGASVANLWGLLSKDFVVLVGLSLLIAIPLAGWMMHRWLEGYAYRIGISWWIFVVAGAGVLAIAVVTVSWQAVRAAMANPVKSLRNE